MADARLKAVQAEEVLRRRRSCVHTPCRGGAAEGGGGAAPLRCPRSRPGFEPGLFYEAQNVPSLGSLNEARASFFLEAARQWAEADAVTVWPQAEQEAQTEQTDLEPSKISAICHVQIS